MVKDRITHVVIKYSAINKRWGILHLKSYQKAFRPSFKTEQEAMIFATENYCLVHSLPKQE